MWSSDADGHLRQQSLWIWICRANVRFILVFQVAWSSAIFCLPPAGEVRHATWCSVPFGMKGQVWCQLSNRSFRHSWIATKPGWQLGEFSFEPVESWKFWKSSVLTWSDEAQARRFRMFKAGMALRGWWHTPSFKRTWWRQVESPRKMQLKPQLFPGILVPLWNRTRASNDRWQKRRWLRSECGPAALVLVVRMWPRSLLCKPYNAGEVTSNDLCILLHFSETGIFSLRITC